MVNACNYKNYYGTFKRDEILKLGKELFYKVILQIESIDDKLDLQKPLDTLKLSPKTPETPDLDRLKDRLVKIMSPTQTRESQEFLEKVSHERVEEALEKLYIYLNNVKTSIKMTSYMKSALEPFQHIEKSNLESEMTRKLIEKIIHCIYKKIISSQYQGEDVKELMELYCKFFRLDMKELKIQLLYCLATTMDHSQFHINALFICMNETIDFVIKHDRLAEIDKLLMGHFRQRLYELRLCFGPDGYCTTTNDLDSNSLEVFEHFLKCIETWITKIHNENPRKYVFDCISEGIQRQYSLSMEKVHQDVKSHPEARGAPRFIYKFMLQVDFVVEDLKYMKSNFECVLNKTFPEIKSGKWMKQEYFVLVKIDLNELLETILINKDQVTIIQLYHLYCKLVQFYPDPFQGYEIYYKIACYHIQHLPIILDFIQNEKSIRSYDDIVSYYQQYSSMLIHLDQLTKQKSSNYPSYFELFLDVFLPLCTSLIDLYKRNCELELTTSLNPIPSYSHNFVKISKFEAICQELPSDVMNLTIVKEFKDQLGFTNQIIVHYITKWIFQQFEHLFLKKGKLSQFLDALDKVFEALSQHLGHSILEILPVLYRLYVKQLIKEKQNPLTLEYKEGLLELFYADGDGLDIKFLQDVAKELD